jgi:hypothetical protein
MQRSYLPAVVVMIAMAFTAIVSSGSSRSQVDAGSYIVNRVSMCTDCHTPMLPDGSPNMDRRLAGAPITFNPAMKDSNQASHAPNLTRAGVLDEWNTEQATKFLMTGRTPLGGTASAPMPRYRMDEKEAAAVTAYLRSLPPVK